MKKFDQPAETPGNVNCIVYATKRISDTAIELLVKYRVSPANIMAALMIVAERTNTFVDEEDLNKNESGKQ